MAKIEFEKAGGLSGDAWNLAAYLVNDSDKSIRVIENISDLRYFDVVNVVVRAKGKKIEANYAPVGNRSRPSEIKVVEIVTGERVMISNILVVPGKKSLLGSLMGWDLKNFDFKDVDVEVSFLVDKKKREDIKRIYGKDIDVISSKDKFNLG